MALVSRFETTCCRRAGSPATAPIDSSRATSSRIDFAAAAPLTVSSAALTTALRSTARSFT